MIFIFILMHRLYEKSMATLLIFLVPMMFLFMNQLMIHCEENYAMQYNYYTSIFPSLKDKIPKKIEDLLSPIPFTLIYIIFLFVESFAILYHYRVITLVFSLFIFPPILILHYPIAAKDKIQITISNLRIYLFTLLIYTKLLLFLYHKNPHNINPNLNLNYHPKLAMKKENKLEFKPIHEEEKIVNKLKIN